MGLGALLGDVVKSFFRKPATENYPYVRYASPNRLRGHLVYDPEKCTGCKLCIKDCPSNAIELIEIDKSNKRFVMRYYADRCVFCAQCVENCRFNCLSMSNLEWELASTNKAAFIYEFGREEDIEFLFSERTRSKT